MSNLRISADNANPFFELVENFFKKDLPSSITTNASIVEALTTAFVSTNKIRYGNAPNPESLVVIRNVIRNCVEKGTTIPILCPWGSKKTKNKESIDVAEVMAIKMLSCLQERVKKYYDPGIQVNVRIEDTSGYHLFQGQSGARESSEVYVQDFLKLLKILDYNFINPVLESSLVTEDKFFSLAEEIKILFLDYISKTDEVGFYEIEKINSWQKLKNLGWSGVIPVEMRDFFRNQYSKMYQGITEEEKTEILSRYFAEALSRLILGATGKEEGWGKDFLQLNFLAAAPGTPFDLVSNRLTYRTIPEDYARTHMPPWRGKGFLEIGNDYVKPKITNWFDPEITKFSESFIEFANDNESVLVKADQKIV